MAEIEVQECARKALRKENRNGRNQREFTYQICGDLKSGVVGLMVRSRWGSRSCKSLKVVKILLSKAFAGLGRRG